jgi:hypothetical protein
MELFSLRRGPQVAIGEALACPDLAARETLAMCVLRGLAVWGVAFGMATGAAAQPIASGPAQAWRTFQGTWTAVGKREVIPLGGGRQASIADFNGSLVLTGAARPEAGFRAQAIVFNDSGAGMVGRAVWTDARGDQVFSELRGQSAAAGNLILGTFIGGSGRYAGATGSYEFSWRFLLEGEDGTVQGQSMGLKGRVRTAPSQATPVPQGPRP